MKAMESNESYRRPRRYEVTSTLFEAAVIDYLLYFHL